MNEETRNKIPDIIHFYVKDKLSIRKIANIVNLNSKTVTKILKEKNVTIRGPISKVDIGKKYGKLEVIRFLHRDRNRKKMWECKCECGGICSVRSNDLICGKQKSCGCELKKSAKKNMKLANDAMRNYSKKFKEIDLSLGIGDIGRKELDYFKNNAVSRGLKYALSDEFLWELYLGQDKKCNLSGLNIWFENKYRKIPRTASLDRIDNSVGYVVGNVQWLHKDVNMLKFRWSQKDLLILCKLIYEHSDLKDKIVNNIDLTSFQKCLSKFPDDIRIINGKLYDSEKYKNMSNSSHVYHTEKNKGLKFINTSTHKVEEVEIISDFCKKYSLTPSCVSRLKNGHIKKYKNWILV